MNDDDRPAANYLLTVLIKLGRGAIAPFFCDVEDRRKAELRDHPRAA